MKLPFDFANKLVLRLVLPGALLTAIFWPVLTAVEHRLGLNVADQVLAPIAIVLFGWSMLFLDMPLYMLLEGRRFWPKRAKAWGIKREEKRLLELQTRRATVSGADQVEIDLEIRRFPLKRSGEPEAQFPTRLGNLIHASELYPDRKYGIDGVFGWYRLWVSIDKDLRLELDDQQALVDSALYASAVAALAAFVCVGYAILRWTTGEAVLAVLPPAGVLLALAPLALVAALALYRAGLSAQAHYGELFCALFDQNIQNFAFEPLLRELAQKNSDWGLLTAPPRERARAAVRFLKFHKYRPLGQTQNRDVKNW